MSYQEESYGRRKRWSEWPRGAKIAVMMAAAIVLIPLFLTICGAVTMWLWNWLMPAIFKLPTIGFWQAVGILILSQILFKGGHMRRAGGKRWKKEKIRERMREECAEPNAE